MSELAHSMCMKKAGMSAQLLQREVREAGAGCRLRLAVPAAARSPAKHAPHFAQGATLPHTSYSRRHRQTAEYTNKQAF